MLTKKEQAVIAKAKILEAAHQLIRVTGYDNIHIKDITDACGMSPGNFYHYFSSKEQLFDELDSTDFYEDFISLQMDNDLDVNERLNSYIKQWIAHSVNDYGSNYMFYWAKKYIQKATQESPCRLYLIASHIKKILGLGIERGELSPQTPIDTIAISTSYTIYGAMAHFAALDNGEDLIKWASGFCDDIMNPALAPYFLNK